MFRMQGLGCARWVRETVANTVVHRTEAGGIQITEPRYLYRGRMHREDSQPVILSMSGEVNENVDFVRADQSRRLGIRKWTNVPNAVHGCANIDWNRNVTCII